MPTLIIAGMHRSGTTLTARWLHQCGLFIGDDLLKSKYDHANPDGNHYEDLAFLQLHRRILSANQLDTQGYLTDEAISINPRFHEAAQTIIHDRQQHAQWGWKEPRTCLLMDFWREHLPGAYVLLVYRHYENVADSLLRRKLDHPKRFRRWFYNLRFHDKQAHVAHYIAVWNRYNQDLLHVVKQSPDNTLVLRIKDIVSHSDDIINYINREWGFKLDTELANTIFEQKRLKQKTHYVDLEHPQVKAVTPEAQATYEQLDSYREQVLRRFV